MKKNISFWGGVLLFFLFVGILLIPRILTSPHKWNGFDFSETGQIGDTIGGITAPFIGIVSAVLLYLALREQIRSTKTILEIESFKDLIEMIERWKKQVQEIKGDETFNLSSPDGPLFAAVEKLTKIQGDETELNDNIKHNYERYLGRLNAEVERLSRTLKFFVPVLSNKQKLQLAHSELFYINQYVIPVSTKKLKELFQSCKFHMLPFENKIHVSLVLSILGLKIQEVDLARRIYENKEPQEGDINVPVFYREVIDLDKAIKEIQGRS